LSLFGNARQWTGNGQGFFQGVKGGWGKGQKTGGKYSGGERGREESQNLKKMLSLGDTMGGKKMRWSEPGGGGEGNRKQPNIVEGEIGPFPKKESKGFNRWNCKGNYF